MGNDESGVISAPRFKMQTVPHHHAHKQRGAEEQGQVTPIPLEKIKETHLRMKWSQICLECITPTNRTGAFYVYAPEKDAVICGYGKTADENILNDIWAFSFAENQWVQLDVTGEIPSPRFGAQATLVDNQIYIFGGENSETYFSDFHVLDLNTMSIHIVEASNESPSPRTGHVFASCGTKICLWAGFNETQLDDLWIFDITTREWHQVESNIPGRTNAAFAVNNNLLYITGASKVDDMITFNFNTEQIDAFTVIGSPPQFDLKGASLVSIDRYLILFGGYIEKHRFAMVRGYDTIKKWWFVYYVVPDDETTTVADGMVEPNGVFMIPRMFGGFTILRPSDRKVYISLGKPFVDPPPIYVFDLSNGIAVMHHQLDLIDMLHNSFA